MLRPCGKPWRSMVSSGHRLSPESAADLFAYFYSVRFFDKPGDAGAR